MTTDNILEMTVQEANLEYVKKDIWEALPFTASFIERNTKTKSDADCILKKVAEHHKEVVDILTKYHQDLMREVGECKKEHIPERVSDFQTKEQFEIFIQRLEEKIEWLEGLKKEAQTIIKSK